MALRQLDMKGWLFGTILPTSCNIISPRIPTDTFENHLTNYLNSIEKYYDFSNKMIKKLQIR
jgi:hypothetical protein